MRKALIGLLMAATMATPLAAQERPRTGAEARAAIASQRAEQRTQRQEQRSERRQQRAVVREQRQPRAERRSEPRTRVPQVQTPASTWPGQQDRVERVITQQDRRNVQERLRDLRTERREDRREDRLERREDRRNDRTDRRPDRREDRLERREDRLERRDRREDRLDRRDRREDRLERREDRRDLRERRRWNREWRREQRYDWQRWRLYNRHLFNPGFYYSPFRNHRYSRFSIGVRLGSPFYSDRYWINDPWQYRLPPAYAGTRWVRYYDDVLLVDLYTGEVIDVIYDFFW